MTTPHKIIARYKSPELQKSWSRGKEGTQAKKATYVNKDDYLKYSPETLARWEKMYDVSAFKMVGKKWEQLDEL